MALSWLHVDDQHEPMLRYDLNSFVNDFGMIFSRILINCSMNFGGILMQNRHLPTPGTSIRDQP